MRGSRGGREPAVFLPPHSRYEDFLCIALIPLFVLLCYQCKWDAWRSFVTRAVVALLPPSSATALPLASDTFLWEGVAYRIDVSCTALDAFFGSIPLLWERRRSLPGNFLFLAAYFLCLSGVNLARLAVGFLVHFHGVPWLLAHEVVAGIFYFGLFLWIARRRGSAGHLGIVEAAVFAMLLDAGRYLGKA